MELEQVCEGVWKAPGARIIDRGGRKRLAVGRGDFAVAMQNGTLVDKTMLIADVLDAGYAATLFCRPRRFGKTLNMTMMRTFLEAPEAGGLSQEDAEGLFAGTEIWEAGNSSYRQYQGSYPIVHLSLASADKPTLKACRGILCQLIQTEFSRHGYLRGSDRLLESDVNLYDRIVGNTASESDYDVSLAALCRMLWAYHGVGVVLLIDEYDAPVMAGHTNGYYADVVSFMRGWLTGAVKDGGATLAFACLTGVQRISKESIFSGLNNLYVSTPMGDDFDERYGFTDAEVEALATYLGHPDCMPEARAWYDGYRFGTREVYNPWSVINYLNKGCMPGAYWANTSGNAVVGELVGHADAETMEQVYGLVEPGGTVTVRLDLNVAFPELDASGDALWSMLYLAGYLTTDDVEDPTDDMRRRALRIPDLEVRRVFRNEVLRRFLALAGGDTRLDALHRACALGDETAFAAELSRVAKRASYLDLISELPCHMLLMGLLFGMPGYDDPTSNREEGLGRYDVRLEPDHGAPGRRPLITLEVKFGRGPEEEALQIIAREGLVQIADRGYDVELPAGADGRLRWGVAFSSKCVAAACERA